MFYLGNYQYSLMCLPVETKENKFPSAELGDPLF